MLMIIGDLLYVAFYGTLVRPARSPCCVIFDRFGLQGKIVMTLFYILHVPRNDKVRVDILCVEKCVGVGGWGCAKPH